MYWSHVYFKWDLNKDFDLYLLLITLLPNNNLCPTSLLIANETNFLLSLISYATISRDSVTCWCRCSTLVFGEKKMCWQKKEKFASQIRMYALFLHLYILFPLQRSEENKHSTFLMKLLLNMPKKTRGRNEPLCLSIIFLLWSHNMPSQDWIQT